jgi:hypothetical protein
MNTENTEGKNENPGTELNSEAKTNRTTESNAPTPRPSSSAPEPLPAASGGAALPNPRRPKRRMRRRPAAARKTTQANSATSSTAEPQIEPGNQRPSGEPPKPKKELCVNCNSEIEEYYHGMCFECQCAETDGWLSTPRVRRTEMDRFFIRVTQQGSKWHWICPTCQKRLVVQKSIACFAKKTGRPLGFFHRRCVRNYAPDMVCIDGQTAIQALVLDALDVGSDQEDGE